IDYSFVTGESMPIFREVGEMVYAGGKQTGSNIEVLAVKEVAQSYLTSLWGREEFKDGKNGGISFVHLLSRWFTYIVLAVAIGAAVYWEINDPSKLWAAVTAVFIIACPCALLLSNTFTNGNILQILGRNHFYLRNAQTIESVAGITHIVFDKTGTLTSTLQQEIVYEGKPLSSLQKQKLAALVACSTHPLSKALVKQFSVTGNNHVQGYKETPGEGIEGFVDEEIVKIGSEKFVSGQFAGTTETSVFISFENKTQGRFRFSNHYRDAVPALIRELRKKYRLSVLSGDNESERQNLHRLFGETATLLFNQKPEDKLDYIKKLQQHGNKVMMIGDGLNDSG
ncbi:MAG: HAD-IC family P-type ATPase, partial [Bacteroidota bacterium]